jgi:hypothetical protein
MSIQRPTPELLQLVAKTISIPNKDKQGAKLPWNPNPQQIKSWNAGWENPWIYILKARQTGETTATCLVDLLFTLLNDLAGNAVETWLVYDKEDNSRDKVALISDWCAQLEIEHRPTELDIRFPNGSRIRGITAGGSRAGASKTVHRLHISELPNWPDASSTWTSLMSCLVEGGFVAIETTMLVAKVAYWRRKNGKTQKMLSLKCFTPYRTLTHTSSTLPIVGLTSKLKASPTTKSR